MKNLKAVLILGLFGSVAGFANQLCVSDDTYQNYENNYSTLATACQIGDKLFWGFALVDNTGFGPDVTEIKVLPLPFDGITNIGLSFNSGGWIADPGFPINDVLSYHVQTLTGAPIIDDATLAITGTLSGAGATATITESFNPFEPGTPLVVSLPTPPSAHVDFSSNMQSAFLIQDQINLFVNPANTGSSSHVSVIENDFSENITVPEPVMSTLIGSGLLLLGFVRRKQFQR